MKIKILHVTPLSNYTDGLQYQDNLLPKYHKKLGYEVTILTGDTYYDFNGQIKIAESGKKDFMNSDGILVTRMKRKRGIIYLGPFKRFKNILNEISNISPDILFIHGVQFVDVIKISDYAKKNKVQLYFDNHADFSNSASSKLSLYLLHKLLWKYISKKVSSKTKYFFGVTPARVDFLRDVYGISINKIKFLPLGADDELVNKCVGYNKMKLISKYGLPDESKLIVSGGKFDLNKIGILGLIKSIRFLPKNYSIILFGSISQNIKNLIEPYITESQVVFLGWLGAEETYEVLSSADIVFFPSKHSVLFEVTAALGKPMILKYGYDYKYMENNVGGYSNILYINNFDEIQIANTLSYYFEEQNNKNINHRANEISNRFLYSNIAKLSLEDKDN